MNAWFIISGIVALTMAFVSGKVRRLPLSSSVIYLAVGVALGPFGFELLNINLENDWNMIERLTEAALIVSIFSSALKLHVSFFNRRWLDPVRLAFLSMTISVLAMLIIGISAGLGFATSLLLGSVLAPTDPVLASDVQVERPYGYHRLRFALTGEAGMNDGTVFPFVMLGIALTEREPMSLAAWVLKDFIWGVAGAVAIGSLAGYLAGRYMLHLRIQHNQELATDSFLAIGLMLLAYAITTTVGGIGFVAVFAAGVALRAVEGYGSSPKTINIHTGETIAERDVATDPEHAATFMMLRLRVFTQNLEQIAEAVVVVMTGAILRASMFSWKVAVIGAALFSVARPGSVFAGLLKSKMSPVERGTAALFGIRGMASLYYLTVLHREAVPFAIRSSITDLTMGVLTISIVLYGISVTPVMKWFDKRTKETPQGIAAEN